MGSKTSKSRAASKADLTPKPAAEADQKPAPTAEAVASPAPAPAPVPLPAAIEAEKKASAGSHHGSFHGTFREKAESGIEAIRHVGGTMREAAQSGADLLAHVGGTMREAALTGADLVGDGIVTSATALKEVVLPERPELEVQATSAPLFSAFLLPIDFSSITAQTVAAACVYSKRLGIKINLLVDLFPKDMVDATFEEEELKQQARDAAAKIADQIRDSGALLGEIYFEEIQDPVEMINAYAKRGCGCIFMGTHGYDGPVRLMNGSTTEMVIRTVPIPVLAVRVYEGYSPSIARPARVLMPVGIAPDTMDSDGLDRLLKFVKKMQAEVVLVQIQPSLPPLSEEAHQVAYRLLETIKDMVTMHDLIVYDMVELKTPYRTASALAEYVEKHKEEIDMVAMCTHGRSGIERVIKGSITETLLRSSPCPVLTSTENFSGW